MPNQGINEKDTDEKESSLDYVKTIIDQTLNALRENEYDKLATYYTELKEVYLALGQNNVAGYDQTLDIIEAIVNGNYKLVEQALTQLVTLKSGILAKVDDAIRLDATLVGKLDPSSVKRQVLTELGEKTVKKNGYNTGEPY